MNKIKLALIALLSICILAAPAVVQAQTSSVEVGEVESSSGFVDDNGRPISNEEYAEIAEERSKGIFEKQPILSAVVIILLLGGIVGVIMLLVSRSKKKNTALAPNAPTNIPAAPQAEQPQQQDPPVSPPSSTPPQV